MSPSPESESLTDSGICQGATYRHRIDDPCKFATQMMPVVSLCAPTFT